MRSLRIGGCALPRLLVAAFLILPGMGKAQEERRTGYEEMAPELQAMQDDPVGNPGLFWVLDGEALYAATPATGAASCEDCHGPGAEAMTGVAARYPAWDEALSRPVDLAGRVDLCRARHQGLPPAERESDVLLSLTAYLAAQSEGVPIAPDPDPRLEPFRAAGEAFFHLRQGQINLSCAQCHDDLAGGRLAAAIIPQAHPTGYPQYRLEWETMGSLDRRFGNCLFGVRAEPLPPGSEASVSLELYLKSRAAGLPVEAPTVRP